MRLRSDIWVAAIYAAAARKTSSPGCGGAGRRKRARFSSRSTGWTAWPRCLVQRRKARRKTAMTGCSRARIATNGLKAPRWKPGCSGRSAMDSDLWIIEVEDRADGIFSIWLSGQIEPSSPVHRMSRNGSNGLLGCVKLNKFAHWFWRVKAGGF